jgi:hypothetical protein
MSPNGMARPRPAPTLWAAAGEALRKSSRSMRCAHLRRRRELSPQSGSTLVRTRGGSTGLRIGKRGGLSRQGHRRGVDAVPVIRPLASRNVVIPLASIVAVPVVRPVPSRNVLVPLLSVVTVPVMRPLASRSVVCADEAWGGGGNPSARAGSAKATTVIAPGHRQRDDPAHL